MSEAKPTPEQAAAALAMVEQTEARAKPHAAIPRWYAVAIAVTAGVCVVLPKFWMMLAFSVVAGIGLNGLAGKDEASGRLIPSAETNITVLVGALLVVGVAQLLPISELAMRATFSAIATVSTYTLLHIANAPYWNAEA